MHEPTDDLTPQEREALTAMRHEEPPRELEERVVDALFLRGALGGPAGVARWGMARSLAAAAAAMLCVALGAAGALWVTSDPAAPAVDPPAATTGGTYALLLLSGPGEFAVSTTEEARRVQEYSAWAGELATEGRLLAGEKLDAEARLLTAADPDEAERLRAADRGDGILAGFFLIRAADYDEAVAIAAACPHLRYGGQVEVRRIEPT